MPPASSQKYPSLGFQSSGVHGSKSAAYEGHQSLSLRLAGHHGTPSADTIHSTCLQNILAQAYRGCLQCCQACFEHWLGVAEQDFLKLQDRELWKRLFNVSIQLNYYRQAIHCLDNVSVPCSPAWHAGSLHTVNKQAVPVRDPLSLSGPKTACCAPVKLLPLAASASPWLGCCLTVELMPVV